MKISRREYIGVTPTEIDIQNEDDIVFENQGEAYNYLKLHVPQLTPADWEKISRHVYTTVEIPRLIIKHDIIGCSNNIVYTITQVEDQI